MKATVGGWSCTSGGRPIPAGVRPSFPLGEGRAKVPGAVIGGLDQWTTLRDGTPDAAVAEARDAVAQTGGTGVIVGPGCVLTMNTPDENVAAVVKALGGPLKPVPGIRL